MSRNNKRTIGFSNRTNYYDKSGLWDMAEISDIKSAQDYTDNSKFRDPAERLIAADADPYYDNVIIQYSANDPSPNYASGHMLKDSSSNHWDETMSWRSNTIQPAVSAHGPKNYHSTFFWSDYMTVNDAASLRFGTSAFTLEFWLKACRNDATECYIMGKGGQAGTTSGTGWVAGIDSSYHVFFYDAVGNVRITSSATVTRDQWYHIAIVRTSTSANQLVIYQDGVSVATGTSSGNFTDTNNLYLGRDRTAASTGYYGGYLFDIRFKNSAQYGSGFTRPSALLDMTGAVYSMAGTEVWFANNTSIQPQGLTVAPSSAYVAKVADSPFRNDTTIPTGPGYGAYRVTGSTSAAFAIYDTVAGNTSLRFGTGAFTVEFWLYGANNGYNQGLFGKGTGNLNAAGGTGWSAMTDGSGNPLWATAATSYTGSGYAYYYCSWNHMAFVRTGTGTNQFFIFMNGIQVYNGTDATNYSGTDPFRIGTSRDQQYGGDYNNFSCLKISTVARYAGAFTVNNSTFIDTQCTVDANTSLLLFASNTTSQRHPVGGFFNDGYDRIIQPHVYQYNPRSGLNTYSRHGYSHLIGPGTGQQTKLLATSAGGDFNFGTNDFSIEFWICDHYAIGNVDDKRILMDCHNYFNDAGITIMQREVSGVDVAVGNTAVLGSQIRLAQRQWVHVCLQRTSGSLALYLDGQRQSETYFASSITAQSNKISFGSGSYNNMMYTSGFYGWMSDIRVCNGSGAYSRGGKNPRSFTLPTAPLTTRTNCVLLTGCQNIIADYSGRSNVVEAGGAQETNFSSAWDAQLSKKSPYKGVAWNYSQENQADHSDTGSGFFLAETGYVASDGTWRSNSWVTRMSSSWTMEFWLFGYATSYTGGTANTYAYTAPNNTVPGWRILVHYNGTSASLYDITFLFERGNSTDQTLSTTGHTGNFKHHSWNHIVVSYSSSATNKMAMFCNGLRVATSASAFTGSGYIYNYNRMYSGTNYGIGTYRLSNIARYNNDITTYTIPGAFTYDSNTALLIKTDMCWVDRVGKTPTWWYGVNISYQYTKWGNGSLRFGNYRSDGPWDYIYIPYNGSMSNYVIDMRQGDFTMEFWACWQDTNAGGISIRSTAPGSCILHYNSTLWIGISTSGYWQMGRVYGTTVQNMVVSNVVVGSVSTGAAAWQHVCVVRRSGNYIFYVNGVEQGNMYGNHWPSLTNGPASDYQDDYNSTNIYIGRDNPGGVNNSWCGYMEDFRFSSIDRYWTRVISNVPTMCYKGTDKPALPTGKLPTR